MSKRDPASSLRSTLRPSVARDMPEEEEDDDDGSPPAEYDDDAADDGGDDDDADDDDEEADDAVMDDMDQVDANGRVLNDGDELLDDEPPPIRTQTAAAVSRVVSAEEKQNSGGNSAQRAATANITRAAAYTTSSLLAASASSTNLDGSKRLWLCPSSYGRPSTVYFDYPLAFGIRRPQPKVACDKPCSLRFKHADSACIYNSVTGTLKRAGFSEQTGTSNKEKTQWNVRWGKHMLPEAFKELKSYQKINHFPSTGGIGRKDRLSRNISRARRLHGASAYNFLPETFLLPMDRSLWEMKFNNEPPGTLWISKPNSSSCGRGIKLVSKLSDIPSKRCCVVSKYIANPLLVNNHKFDLRIYVLVTSFHPLKVYLYDNGLARFCTSAYDISKKNLKKKYIHLTNFSVNKRSPNFVVNTNDKNLEQGEDGGDSSKWSLIAFKKWLLSRYGSVKCHEVWSCINDIFIKTLLSVETNVSSHMVRTGTKYDQCFELYGFDILLDANLKPWLMEVNCSSPLDKRIKNQLLTDVFHTIGVKPAFVKEKEGPASKEKPNKTDRLTSSGAISSRASSSGTDTNVMRGGTMGPSNSKASRRSSTNTPLANTNNSAAAATSSDVSITGGRISKLKNTRLDQYFNHLNKYDLSLLRDFRDETNRAVSGGWKLIFPIGASSTVLCCSDGSSVCVPQPSSLESYAQLFEYEKYEDLLYMKFQAHFSEKTKEKICKGQKIEASEVMSGNVPTSASHSSSNNNNNGSNEGNNASVNRRGSNRGSMNMKDSPPFASKSPSLTRPSPPPFLYDPSSSSASILSQRLQQQLFVSDSSGAASRPSHLSVATGEENNSVAPFGSTHSPLTASPEDSETDEVGRPKRRFFYEQGVALQPYVPHAVQYHDGWSPRGDSVQQRRQEEECECDDAGEYEAEREQRRAAHLHAQLAAHQHQLEQQRLIEAQLKQRHEEEIALYHARQTTSNTTSATSNTTAATSNIRSPKRLNRPTSAARVSPHAPPPSDSHSLAPAPSFSFGPHGSAPLSLSLAASLTTSSLTPTASSSTANNNNARARNNSAVRKSTGMIGMQEGGRTSNNKIILSSYSVDHSPPPSHSPTSHFSRPLSSSSSHRPHASASSISVTGRQMDDSAMQPVMSASAAAAHSSSPLPFSSPPPPPSLLSSSASHPASVAVSLQLQQQFARNVSRHSGSAHRINRQIQVTQQQHSANQQQQQQATLPYSSSTAQLYTSAPQRYATSVNPAAPVSSSSPLVSALSSVLPRDSSAQTYFLPSSTAVAANQRTSADGLLYAAHILQHHGSSHTVASAGSASSDANRAKYQAKLNARRQVVW